MHSKSTIRLFAIWIACFAILMNALAPSISHAANARQSGFAEDGICRVDKSADGQSAPGKMLLMNDCDYCLVHAGSHALPPPALGGFGVFGAHASRPFLFYRAPQPLLALSAAPARGPPVIA
jgi:hypothetical protein